MLDYRIETFLVVCQEMNFTKAAKRLKITQPAVSNHIKQLEEYYDVLLFGYEGKKIYLTKEGKMLYEAMVALHNNEIYLREQIRHEKDEKEVFRFGATLSIGEFMMPDKLENYILKHPLASVHMKIANTSELLDDLAMGAIDFAIVDGTFSKTEYESIIFDEEKLCFVCSSDNPHANRQLSLQKLINERLIICTDDSDCLPVLEQFLEDKNYQIDNFTNRIEISNIRVVKDLVQRNLGIAFMYEMAVIDEIKEGTLAKINIRGFNLKNEFSVVWKKDNIFKDYYKKTARELLE